MDKSLSVVDVKRMARKYGAGFFKGKGYFYFTPPKGLLFRQEGVYVISVTQLSLDEWEQELKDKISEAQKLEDEPSPKWLKLSKELTDIALEIAND